ncbi:hypothetical protein C8R45DRAFT_1190012 [Mycena sanguinolenta]|nr:hypothetical protein C8R45DRAFT_1190012 [Mycena sanguinolenta]
MRNEKRVQELKITSLESTSELRDRERAALEDLIAPIRILPVELLANIFDLAIRDYKHVPDVFRISQVCSHWRKATHGTPQLWTGPLRPVLTHRTGSDGEADANGLKAWLLRSAPLTIPISLTLGSESINERILDELLGTAPPWHLVVVPSFTTVPSLRELDIEVYTNAIPVVLPWGQLNHLTLTSDSSNITRDILAQCPNLIKADLSTAGLDHTRQDILVLSHLQALSFRFFWDNERFSAACQLLRWRSCLLISCTGEEEEEEPRFWTEGRLTAFQLRVPNITRLQLEESFLTSDDLTTVLRHAPSLTCLELTHCHNCIDEQLISALRYEDGKTLWLPVWKFCTSKTSATTLQKLHIMARMIASRWWSEERLVPPAVSRWTVFAKLYQW